ncbi:MAG: tRNA (adenosine(37)-N6)-dimethylallyltransferase MiaA [bacterium]
MERIVLVIVGPTCSGKTTLGLKMASEIDGEIISADSRQVFKFLDVGTAKPSHQVLSQIKHHFVDILNPDQECNASKFEQLSLSLIEKIYLKNCNPIVVGGSGLYISALIDGIFNSVDTDEDYRDELLQLRKENGNEFLYQLLNKADPVSASKMLPQNWKRVMRALEVFHLTGEPIWKHQQNYKRESNFVFKQYGLMWDREALYQNIEARVDRMIETGLIEETKRVLELGYSPELNSLNTVGYKEIISYLKNEITLDRAVELIKRNTRRYAKRQLTWFRKDERIKWFDVNGEDDLEIIGRKIVKEIN